MESEAKTEERVPRCLLCGDRCWFEDQSPSRMLAIGVFAVGWLLPVGLAERLDKLRGGALAGLAVGGLIWLGTVAYLFFRQTAWICRTCGAIYPAKKVVREGRAAFGEQPVDQEKV